MSYTITVAIPKQGATRHQTELGEETLFDFTAPTAELAQQLVDKILLTGVRRTFAKPKNSLTPAQTVFYPAHLVKRITVVPALPE
jgi:hypothetical protein